MVFRKMALAAAAALALGSVPQAHALTFNLIDTGGAAPGTQARQGFELAAGYWASVLGDNVTINLQIGFQPLAPNVLGQAGSARSLLSMNQTYAALAADQSSALDAQAVAGLLPLGLSALGSSFGAVSLVANAFNGSNNGYVDSATRLDNDGGVNNSATAITKASAKALGIVTDVNGDAVDYTAVDGTITFSSDFAFDFNPTNGVDAGSFDFIGVAIHEIGHTLGFVSGVDSYDRLTGPSGPSATSGLLEGFVVASQLDLFRYSAPGVLDWSTSDADKYMSIDGGNTQLLGDARFSLGRFNGDGRQASHFKDTEGCVITQLAIMDPTLCDGRVAEITALDLAALDAIGWNTSFDVLSDPGYIVTTADIYASAVPEPSAWALMLMGLAGATAAARRRQRVAAGG